MKTVLLDVDGVICNFIGGVLELVRKHGGGARTPEEITRFDFAKELNLTPEVKKAVYGEIANTPYFWSDLNAFPGALAGVARLREVADVYIVTSPWNTCKTWLYEREAWLKSHFDISHDRVLAGSAKHLVAGDVLVDDKTDTLERWDAERGPARYSGGKMVDAFAVQWKTPHNRLDGWEGHSTKSWEQLVEWCK